MTRPTCYPLTDLDRRLLAALTTVPQTLAALLKTLEPATRRWDVTKAGVRLRLEGLERASLVESVGPDAWRLP